ncbi:glycosyltransferase family 32 protein [Streptomyces platensis]|uniref:glycosyltransferase family 32 protein n=1 Tax=Streptomyces platensis TaxID=58346 RepID=UPI00386CE82E|nr:glycosyltransferase [Streptomyces platensis]
MLFGLSPDFGGKPFSLVHYLAIRSAYEVNRPDAIHLYYQHRPAGIWWERSLPYMIPVRFDPPEDINGFPLRHVAHRADVARLEILREHGGIYLDMDVLCVRPFDPLLTYRTVLGLQLSRDPASPTGELRREGLCNAVILAEPGAEFVQEWLAGWDPRTSRWRGFRSRGYDEHWDEYSVRYPDMLARELPSAVHVEGHRSFFWPSWNESGMHLFFGDGEREFPEAYCHHLWESEAWDRYLRNLTEADIRRGKSPFSAMARRFLD